MSKKLTFGFIGAALLALPLQFASAHESHIYRIGNQSYQITVGSLNEPIAVDDNTGVELIVAKVPAAGASESHGHEASPNAVTGLDQTLKVELIAGDQKKVLDLRPKFGVAGTYTAKFYPTVQTTYTYRFFGAIDNVDVDLPFSCNPAGHPQVAEDKTETKVGNATRLSKRGAFGCPMAKADLGFPEQSASIYEINERANDLGATSRNMTLLAIVLGLIGIGLGFAAWRRK